MKYIASLSLTVAFFCAGTLLANEKSLEGQVFERTFETTPVGSSTPMTLKHSLNFEAGWVAIETSSWSNTPPNKCNYGLEFKGKEKNQLDRVTVICNGQVTRYKFVAEENAVPQLHSGKVVLTQIAH